MFEDGNDGHDEPIDETWQEQDASRTKDDSNVIGQEASMITKNTGSAVASGNESGVVDTIRKNEDKDV